MNSGMFQSVEMDGVTELDGSVEMQISFIESQWQSADQSFRCVNVGLLAQSRAPEGHEKMTDQQQEELAKSKEKDSKSMLPKSVEREISGWLRGETRVTVRMLEHIRGRVQKWYDEEGYACAQVVNIGNLSTNDGIIK